MNNIKLVLLLLITGQFNNIASAGTWTRNESPFNFKQRLVTEFESLPLKAEISDKTIAWPANHWDNINGGIAYRWTADDSQNFTYNSPSYRKLKSYSSEQIRELSPAEKFSILIGDYKYKLVRNIWSVTSPNEAYWNGICHGVAPASIHYSEPKQKKVVNRAGIEIEFYSSDIKAILAYYYANIARTTSYYIGRRCNAAEGSFQARNNPDCSDLNPGSFHLILSNFIGLQDKPILVDMDRYVEVWNQAAFSYESYEVSEHVPTHSSAIGTVKRLRIQTSLKYTSAINRHFDAIIGTEDAYYLDESYEYYIELDYKGRIIGGEWMSENRPDFLWMRGKSRFQGIWRKLNVLL
jgi:hypothetical protein